MESSLKSFLRLSFNPQSRRCLYFVLKCLCINKLSTTQTQVLEILSIPNPTLEINEYTFILFSNKCLFLKS